MREDLLGYLLNALDDAERKRVSEALQRDPQLRQELEVLRRQLRPLDATNVDFEPPAMLAELTCDLVEDCAEERPFVVPAKGPRSAGRPRVRSAASEACVPSGVWSAADTIVVAGVLLAVSLIFFPAIAGSRYRAQVTACGENLRNLGFALAGYSEHHQGFFPSIPVSGNRSAAGIYAALLREALYLDDPRVVLCPGSRLAARGAEFRIPTLAELDRDSRAAAVGIAAEHGWRLRLRSGIRGQRRLHDATQSGALQCRPARGCAQPAPAGSAKQQPRRARPECPVPGPTHRISPSPQSEPLGDDLFRNRYGYVEAGLDERDSVLVPSNARPLLGTEQGGLERREMPAAVSWEFDAPGSLGGYRNRRHARGPQNP